MSQAAYLKNHEEKLVVPWKDVSNLRHGVVLFPEVYSYRRGLSIEERQEMPYLSDQFLHKRSTNKWMLPSAQFACTPVLDYHVRKLGFTERFTWSRLGFQIGGDKDHTSPQHQMVYSLITV